MSHTFCKKGLKTSSKKDLYKFSFSSNISYNLHANRTTNIQFALCARADMVQNFRLFISFLRVKTTHTL